MALNPCFVLNKYKKSILIEIITPLFPQIHLNVFDDSSIDSNLALRKSNRYQLFDEMTDESNKSLPQIAITAYESNEEDIEVTNIFNVTNEKKNNEVCESRSVSPNPVKHKSRIILKSPISKRLQGSLSPGVSDMNGHTDVEVMSDSDDEKDYIRTGNLTPGPIDYFILTDVEDLSEDEEHEKYNRTREELTDTEHFTDDKEVYFNNDTEQTDPTPLDSSAHFPQPHREILFHSKDGTVSAMSPIEESNLVRLKTPSEEVKGFESEEEIITTEEFGDTESYVKNNNTYYHDIDMGVVESVETVKHERSKHKCRNRMFPKKSGAPETAEWGKRRFRNKNHCNSEVEDNFDKRSEENKKVALSKYMSEPTLCKMAVPALNQIVKTKNMKHKANNQTFVIHDNRNGFSISIDFEGLNSVLLNVGRDNGNLSMRWFNNGVIAGRLASDYNNVDILELLESGHVINRSLCNPKRPFDVDLFTYGTMKTLQNRYFTYISVHTTIQPVNIVQLYINRPFQAQFAVETKPLVQLYSLKDMCTSVERLHPSSITRLPAFKMFDQKNTEKREKQKIITLVPENHVSDVINIFENMSGSPKLGQKFNYKKLSNSDTNLKNCGLKPNRLCAPKNTQIGNYQYYILPNN